MALQQQKLRIHAGRRGILVFLSGLLLTAGLTLQLARLLGQGRDLRAIGELTRFLHSRYPEAEQTRQLALLQQHLAR